MEAVNLIKNKAWLATQMYVSLIWWTKVAILIWFELRTISTLSTGLHPSTLGLSYWPKLFIISRRSDIAVKRGREQTYPMSKFHITCKVAKLMVGYQKLMYQDMKWNLVKCSSLLLQLITIQGVHATRA